MRVFQEAARVGQESGSCVHAYDSCPFDLFTLAAEDSNVPREEVMLD